MSQENLMVRARTEVLASIRNCIPDQLRTSVQQVAAISGGGFRNADIQYVIGGPDLNKLTEYSDALLEKMKTIPDVVDPDSTLITGKPELRVVIDRARAADLGVQSRRHCPGTQFTRRRTESLDVQCRNGSI